MDTFTCGTCRMTFHELDTFLQHKHGFPKNTCTRTGKPRSKVDTVVEDHVLPHPKTLPAASSAGDISTTFLNAVPRMDGLMTSRSEESTKWSSGSTCIEAGSSEGEDRDVILIEISESKRQNGELRARVCRASIEDLEDPLENPSAASEELLATSCEGEKLASRRGMAVLIEELPNGKSDALCVHPEQPHASNSEVSHCEVSSINGEPHSNELCITQSCNVLPAVYVEEKLVESNTEADRRLTPSSPQGRNWTPDSVTYKSTAKAPSITRAESQPTSHCREKLPVGGCDVTYEYADGGKAKTDHVVEAPCEDVPPEGGGGSIEGAGAAVEERMKNTSCKAFKRAGPDGASAEEEKLLPRASCSEEIFARHRDGAAADGTLTQGLGEGALLNSEGVNLTPGDCSELEYTPSPGIYTLILNTDNTFSLVSEGCQGSATQTGDQVFVCWPCQKFAPSQAEILSHISASHPQDLANINQCMLELSALSPSRSSSTAESLQHLGGRKARRKLGRPRKGESAGQEEPEPARKRFKVEAEGTLCLDCDRLFPKQRQFDKHRCSVWQDNHLPSDQALSRHPAGSLAALGRSAEEILDLEALHKEEAEEEEWQGSATCKPRGRPRGAEKRKRGRPPKVDQLGTDTVDNEAFSPVHLPKEEPEDTPKSRGNTHQPSASSHHAGNSTKCGSDASPSIGPSQLQHIPTLPLFSNPHQQERLHKWIAQTDLSFVDVIIDEVYPERKTSEKRDASAMFTCRECKLLFRTLTSCRRHCAKHMTKKAFTCPDCDFATANVGGLYSHYRNHTQNLYSCDKCDFRARIKAHYRDHLETHNPCRHVCHLCQRPYSTSSSLRSHIYLNHRNEEGMKYLWWLRRKNREQDRQNVVFQCPVCHQLFSELPLANQHLAAHGHGAPRVVLRCEVCGLEPLFQGMLKKHLVKHKVIYICCVCYKPQVTASCLHSHLREGVCSRSSGEDGLKLSLLYSYTHSETLPSLISSKVLGIGSLLQDMHKFLRHQQLPPTKTGSNLRHQMQVAGYRQISELLQDKLTDLTGSACRTEREVMKIVINTRCVAESSKCNHPPASQTSSRSVAVTEHPEASRLEEEHFRGPDRSEERVVVISNIGEEQPLVVEEKEMMKANGRASLSFESL